MLMAAWTEENENKRSYHAIVLSVLWHVVSVVAIAWAMHSSPRAVSTESAVIVNILAQPSANVASVAEQETPKQSIKEIVQHEQKEVVPPKKITIDNKITKPTPASTFSSVAANNSLDKTADARLQQAFTQAIFDAAYLNNPPPLYPATAKRRKMEGQVMLKVEVSAQGKAQTVHIVNSSGFNLLDNAAMQAVQKWRFVPAKSGQVAVASQVMVPVIFKIKTAS